MPVYVAHFDFGQRKTVKETSQYRLWTCVGIFEIGKTDLRAYRFYRRLSPSAPWDKILTFDQDTKEWSSLAYPKEFPGFTMETGERISKLRSRYLVMTAQAIDERNLVRPARKHPTNMLSRLGPAGAKELN